VIVYMALSSFLANIEVIFFCDIQRGSKNVAMR